MTSHRVPSALVAGVVIVASLTSACAVASTPSPEPTICHGVPADMGWLQLAATDLSGNDLGAVGIDLVAELRRRRTASPVRVVIVSASALAGERAKAMSSGADAFIGKPFGPSELTDLLVDLSARV